MKLSPPDCTACRFHVRTSIIDIVRGEATPSWRCILRIDDLPSALGTCSVGIVRDEGPVDAEST